MPASAQAVGDRADHAGEPAALRYGIAPAGGDSPPTRRPRRPKEGSTGSRLPGFGLVQAVRKRVVHELSPPDRVTRPGDRTDRESACASSTLVFKRISGGREAPADVWSAVPGSPHVTAGLTAGTRRASVHVRHRTAQRSGFADGMRPNLPVPPRAGTRTPRTTTGLTHTTHHNTGLTHTTHTPRTTHTTDGYVVMYDAGCPSSPAKSPLQDVGHVVTFPFGPWPFASLTGPHTVPSHDYVQQPSQSTLSPDNICL
jgi:hypothetical protein